MTRPARLLLLVALTATTLASCGLASPDDEQQTATTPGASDAAQAPCTTGSCADGYYCDFTPDDCATHGVCRPRSTNCKTVDHYAPRCGCDGKTYANDCVARAAGVDLGDSTACAAPDGWLACGAQFCDVAERYCEIDESDVATIPDAYACRPLPASCATPACACLAPEIPCSEACVEVDVGTTFGLRLTCPAG